MKEASTMLNGTVKFFNSTKGFGFLTTPEGEDIFFHKSNVKDTGFRDELRQGDNVKFEIRVEQKGKRAYNIARVSSEVPKEKDMPSTEVPKEKDMPSTEVPKEKDMPSTL